MTTHFEVPSSETVSPANQPLFNALKGKLGFVPNLYATFAHSAHALPAYLALQAARSSLSVREREVVNLAVSEVNGCEYCLAAHTVIARKFGYSDAQILEIRSGRAGFDPRLDALARLVHDVTLERGHADPGTCSLTIIADGLGLPAHRPHTAEGDTLTAAQVFLAMATHLEARGYGSVRALTGARRDVRAWQVWRGPGGLSSG